MKKTNNIIPIVLACDDKYVKYAAVTIASIMSNSSKCNLYNIYILTEYISERNIHLLQEQVSEKKNFNIEIINIKNIDFSDFYICPNSHINVSTYYRFFIADLLPQYDKVVYLDCDLVVNIDIANMYNHNLDNHILGAVEDFWFRNDKIMSKLYSKEIEHAETYSEFTLSYCDDVLGLNKDWKYFNAGVILFNTKIMREIKFSEELVKKLNIVKSPALQDQDILNSCVCNDKFYGGGYLNLDIRYNIFGLDTPASLLIKQRFFKFFGLIDNIKVYIIHYVGPNKPWKCKRISGQLFYKYLYGKYTNKVFTNEIESEKGFPTQSNLRKFLYKYVF